MSRLRFGIIGCGRISKKHIEALLYNRKEAELAALCDIDIEKAQLRRIQYMQEAKDEQNNIQIFTNYKKLLIDRSIDVAIIATESGYHGKLALEFLKAGINVIVEKPMALSLEEADEMIFQAERNKVKLCICHQNRFNKAVIALRKKIEEGSFGKLINGTARILWCRDDDYYKQASWRGTWELDGGTLMNQCIHNIDLLQWMMGGDIEYVFSDSSTYIRNIQAEDFGAAIIKFKSGAIGVIEGSACVFPENLEETLSIFGQNGTVCLGGMAVNNIEYWNFKDENLKVNPQNKIENTITDVYGEGHAALIKDMIDAIYFNHQPLVNGEEGRKAMEIVLSCYKSRLTNKPVYFPLDNFSTQEMENQLYARRKVKITK